ncbi:7330_t:CDS:2 [Rhizophagus irregularis]|nr:7330_t:CDS:2 [Rhizophagus irregularis]
MSPAYTKQKTRHASVPAESESEWSTNEKLTGYTIVEPKTWQYIKYGFVLKNPYDVNPKGSPEKKQFMKLQNGFNNTVQDYKQ